MYQSLKGCLMHQCSQELYSELKSIAFDLSTWWLGLFGSTSTSLIAMTILCMHYQQQRTICGSPSFSHTPLCDSRVIWQLLSINVDYQSVLVFSADLPLPIRGHCTVNSINVGHTYTLTLTHAHTHAHTHTHSHTCTCTQILF